jgi:hypothetical protein
MDKEFKIAFASFLMVIFTVCGIYVLISPTEYNCNDVKPEVLSSSLKACFEKESKSEKLKLEQDRMEKEFEYKEKQELHKTCRLAIEKGIKNCEDIFSDKMKMGKLIKSYSCESLVKRTICQPKMFLWKLWYF